MTDIVELDGRTFVPAEEFSPPESDYVSTKRDQPTLTLKDDDLFLITDTLGNVNGSPKEESNSSLGLFCRDTRFLSLLEMQIEKRAPVLLSSTAQKGFALSVLCANPYVENRLPAEVIGIQRELVLNGALFEELTITNYSREPLSFELSLTFGADFADLFQIRGFTREHQGQLLQQVRPGQKTPDVASLQELALETGELALAYQALDGALVESRIQFSHRKPDRFSGFTAIWQLSLDSHETQQIGYRLQPLINSRAASGVSAPMTLRQAMAAESMEEQNWCSSVTRIRSDNRAFNQVIERAEQDIYLLRQTFGKDKILAAGIPWFSTLFGRDSIIAAAQTLILDPRIACQTLHILAQYQGKVDDEWREEQPGKILHELRLGEMARCGEVPHTPYYGTVDATALWLMLYAEYYAWTHDRDTLEELWDNALAAMEWIDRGCRSTGYLTYYRKSSKGLRNQGWKDSEDCIVNRKGELAEGSIALSEVQGYVYAAKMRLSEIARLKKRIDLADRWQEEAKELQARFNRDFWVEDQGYCAMALDGDGNPVDGIGSNPGHCLSLGILYPEKARSVAERLRAPDMFNGWGIRTLSSLSPAYNPMGYHIGSVWPHDNALIALGLRTLGLTEQALEVAQGIIDMTLQQPYQRPPELFCGYERTVDNSPVRYPVACSPQAWATGAIFQFLQIMVNLVPDAPSNCLRVIDPALPESVHHLSLQNLRIGETLLDLDFERSGSTTACRVTKKRGNLRVIIEA
ncbi:MAG: amylo-alpha-1,6-glucosidase [Synechococcales cyanobacterium C42_A2020_086]|jgi:glycogen debranching enzyme|nr:amylo-alpha-1,6-glucosidase [Synechococcales cyanobacterium C42_A2020_086]